MTVSGLDFKPDGYVLWGQVGGYVSGTFFVMHDNFLASYTSAGFSVWSLTSGTSTGLQRLSDSNNTLSASGWTVTTSARGFAWPSGTTYRWIAWAK